VFGGAGFRVRICTRRGNNLSMSLIWSMWIDRTVKGRTIGRSCTRSQGGQYICTVLENDVVVGPTWGVQAQGCGLCALAGRPPPRWVRTAGPQRQNGLKFDATPSYSVLSHCTHDLTCQLSTENRASTLALPCPTSQQKGACVASMPRT